MPAPPISALQQLKTLDSQLVLELRNRILKTVNDNPDEYEPEDIEELKRNDWQIQRFILECKLNPDHSYELLNNALKWRKNENVNHLSAVDFPAEYYQSGYIFRHGRDRSGAIVLYFRANIHRKTNEWNPVLKRFFIYQIEQIDRDCDGVTLVIDCTDIGMSNVDMDLLKFIVTSFSKYYPKLFDAIIIHQLPFLLQYLFKLVQTWLPEDDRKFFHMTNRKTLSNFIEPGQLPSFLLENNESNDDNDEWRRLPNDQVLPSIEFIKVNEANFSPKDYEKLDYLRNYLK